MSVLITASSTSIFYVDWEGGGMGTVPDRPIDPSSSSWCKFAISSVSQDI